MMLPLINGSISMSDTVRPRHRYNDDRRPAWQQHRGIRYGNLRRQQATLKVRARRAERARLKAERVCDEDME